METTETTNFIYNLIQHAHSGLRYVLLVLLLMSIIKAFGKRRGGNVYPGKDSLFLATFITTHIQLLLGLLLYFIFSPYVRFEGGIEAIMGDKATRFYTVEHLVGMLLAIIIITVGYVKAKRQAELNKGWKTIGIYYLIGLVLIVLSIPWPFRGLTDSWF